MKLTKDKLIRLTKNGLEKLGYIEIKDTITVAQGLYIKVLENDFYLTLGLTISRYYDSLFTASFYLSKTTIWGAGWGDIPKDSYERVGHFLTMEERIMLLDKDYSKKGVRDAWWDGSDDKAVDNFLETVQITENRFLNQPDFFDSIKNSKDVNELWIFAKKVIDKIDSNDINGYNYQFTPKKPIDDIPIEWFKASERVIIEENAILNINTVKRLAADSYRQKTIKR